MTKTDNWILLLIGIACCVFDAFIPQETVISWIGLGCVIVALMCMWKNKNEKE